MKPQIRTLVIQPAKSKPEAQPKTIIVITKPREPNAKSSNKNDNTTNNH